MRGLSRSRLILGPRPRAESGAEACRLPRVGRAGGAGVGGTPWPSTLALVTRRRRVGVLGLLARTGGNFGGRQCGIARSVVWNFAVTTGGNCFPQMCLKLSFLGNYLFWAGGMDWEDGNGMVKEALGRWRD